MVPTWSKKFVPLRIFIRFGRSPKGLLTPLSAYTNVDRLCAVFLYNIVTMALPCVVSEVFNVENVLTLKSESEVTI